MTNERIDLLNKVNFVWEAQRGGPRRKRKAAVEVPAEPNPVAGVGPPGSSPERSQGGFPYHHTTPQQTPEAESNLSDQIQIANQQSAIAMGSAGFQHHLLQQQRWNQGGLGLPGMLHPSMFTRPPFSPTAHFQHQANQPSQQYLQANPWTAAAMAYGMVAPNTSLPPAQYGAQPGLRGGGHEQSIYSPVMPPALSEEQRLVDRAASSDSGKDAGENQNEAKNTPNAEGTSGPETTGRR